MFPSGFRDGMTFRESFERVGLKFEMGYLDFVEWNFWTMLDRICDNLFYWVLRYRCYIFARDRMKFEVERNNIWSVENLWCNLFYGYIYIVLLRWNEFWYGGFRMSGKIVKISLQRIVRIVIVRFNFLLGKVINHYIKYYYLDKRFSVSTNNEKNK